MKKFIVITLICIIIYATSLYYKMNDFNIIKEKENQLLTLIKNWINNKNEVCDWSIFEWLEHINIKKNENISINKETFVYFISFYIKTYWFSSTYSNLYYDSFNHWLYYLFWQDTYLNIKFKSIYKMKIGDQIKDIKKQEKNKTWSTIINTKDNYIYIINKIWKGKEYSIEYNNKIYTFDISTKLWKELEQLYNWWYTYKCYLFLN